ncbi:hypothetical protein GJAV_G00251570 [Gymnothorax javanicus]|nr:hypothetical protein GJAV_G00251570 [Gymnothorax javanicus]
MGVPPELVAILRALNSAAQCQIRSDEQLSDPFPPTSGVHQGCVAAPNLFNVAIDYWLAGTLQRSPDLGVQFHSHYTDLCYADDVVLFAQTIDVMSDALSVMAKSQLPLDLLYSLTMSELFMECEEEELEPWQRRIPEINLVDDDDDDDDEPIFVGEIRGCKAPRSTAPGPAPVVKSVNQRQVAPTATRSVMPVSPVMRSGGAAPTSPQRPQQTPAASSSTQSGSCSSSAGLPAHRRPDSFPHLNPSDPQPIIINNQGYIVTSPQITSNSTLIASLANQYPPGTSFTVLPAGQQLLPQVTPAKVVPGVIHRPQVQLIQNNVVTLANVQSPPQAKQFSAGKLQPVQMNATTLQPIQLVPSAVQGKIATPPKPQGSPGAATKQTSPSLQVMSSAGVGMNTGKRESPPDALSNATKRSKLELGVSNVSDFIQNGTPFRKKCPKCNIQFNLPDPMKSHMRYCCSHLIESVFPTTSRLGKPSTSVRMMDAERGKLIMLVTEFYYGRHEGDRMVHKEQKANVTFKCNSCLKVLKNNIRFMNHMKHHLELEKQSNESWDSHTTCQHCFRQYSTPFQLQCHIESAHSPYESTTNCKICELAFETEQALLEHMKDNHKPGEMPYVCQVCNFRSSFFSEVETHFRAVHENTKDLLCPFCLKVLRSGHIYMQHYMRHQKKGIHRCGKCRLNFLTYKEKTEHKTQFHRTFKKPKSLEGLPPGTKVTIRASLLGSSPTSAGPPSKSFVIPSSPTSKLQSKPPSSSAKSKSTAQSSSTTRGRPYMTKKQERLNSRLQERSSEALRNIRFRNHLGPQKCLECYTKFTDFYSHYPMVLNCSACKYCTCCSKSYEHHMIRFHSAVSRDRFKKVKMPKGSLRSITLVCLNCDFLADASGTNLMSKHLIDRPHHNCQVIIEKGISSEEVSETGPEPEASAGDLCDSTRVESDVVIGDADPSDTSRKKQENRALDSQSDSSAHQTEPSEAKDSEPVLEKEGKGEKQEEPLSEATTSSGPADRETEEGEEVDSAKDDVPFEEFLTKADEGELESSDVGEDSSVHLEPLTPSKVLEHEATEILQKGGGSDPESKAGDPADDANDGSRPSSPDKSGDTSA